MRILPTIILSLAIILAAIVWHVFPLIVPLKANFEGPVIDSGARIEIEMLTRDIENAHSKIDRLTSEISKIRGNALASQGNMLVGQEANSDLTHSNGIIDVYAQVVQIANRTKVNQKLRLATPGFLRDTFGMPRENLTDKCEPMTNPRLESKLVLEEVGPVRVRMLKPAVDSLKRVFESIQYTDPDLYSRINTAGSLCVRSVRGVSSSASAHAYGLAVDLNIDGVLDVLGDGKTQLGLTILADFFHEEGWVWGAAWKREDSMHFEVSRNKIEEWLEAGLL